MGSAGVAPARSTAKAPRDSIISGLNGRALALAVYASFAGLLAAERKTSFWVLAKLSQAGLVTRRVPTKGFQGVLVTSSSPFPKLAWRRLRPLFPPMLRPYPLLVGLLTVAMLAMHGAQYLLLKVPRDSLHDRVREWAWHTWGVFLVLYILTTDYTLAAVPRAVVNVAAAPWAAAVVVLNVLAIANIPRSIYRSAPGQAFLSSAAAVVALVALFSVALWPNLVTASNDPSRSLTIYNAASSEKTLGIMLVIALIGMPLALTYTGIVHWTFRRRVEVGEHSY
jgi:cytochrome bd-type quinol oxidase subunit 2